MSIDTFNNGPSSIWLQAICCYYTISAHGYGAVLMGFMSMIDEHIFSGASPLHHRNACASTLAGGIFFSGCPPIPLTCAQHLRNTSGAVSIHFP